MSLAKQAKPSALMSYFNKTCEAKVKAVCEYISEKIDCKVKTIVFGHMMMLDDEATAIKKKVNYMRLDGSTSPKVWQSQVYKFNKEESCLIAILSLTVCGTGLNIRAGEKNRKRKRKETYGIYTSTMS